MSLGIWFAENIRNVLLAANNSHNPSLRMVKVLLAYIEEGYRVGSVTAITEAYKAGHMAALVTVALAFGLSPVALWPEQRRLTDGQTLPEEGL